MPKKTTKMSRWEIEAGVVIEVPASGSWQVVPKRIKAAELLVDAALVRDYRRDAAEVCDGRWSMVEAIWDNDPPVMVWAILLNPKLSKRRREQAWEDVQTWSGIRINSGDCGEGWEAVSGDSYGTMDWGLSVHELRFYRDHAVVFFVAGEKDASVQQVLDGIQVSGRASNVKRAPRPRADVLESLLAPVGETSAQKDCPGPATRDIQRLATCSFRRQSRRPRRALSYAPEVQNNFASPTRTQIGRYVNRSIIGVGLAPMIRASWIGAVPTRSTFLQIPTPTPYACRRRDRKTTA